VEGREKGDEALKIVYPFSKLKDPFSKEPERADKRL